MPAKLDRLENEPRDRVKNFKKGLNDRSENQEFGYVLGIFLTGLVMALEAFENLSLFFELWRLFNDKSGSGAENLDSDRSKN